MTKKKRKKKNPTRNRLLIFNVYNHCKTLNFYDILYKYFKYFKMSPFLATSYQNNIEESIFLVIIMTIMNALV